MTIAHRFCSSSSGAVPRGAHAARDWAWFFLSRAGKPPRAVFVPYWVLCHLDDEMPLPASDEAVLRAIDANIDALIAAARRRLQEEPVRLDAEDRLVLDEHDLRLER